MKEQIHTAEGQETSEVQDRNLQIVSMARHLRDDKNGLRTQHACALAQGKKRAEGHEGHKLDSEYACCERHKQKTRSGIARAGIKTPDYIAT